MYKEKITDKIKAEVDEAVHQTMSFLSTLCNVAMLIIGLGFVIINC